MPLFIQWALLLFGAWLICLCLTGLREKKMNLDAARHAGTWPTVIGKVTASRIVEGKSISSETRQEIFTYRPEIEYTYSAGGKEFSSTRQAFGKILWYQPAEAEEFKSRFAPGTSVQVYHNPANPRDAVIDPDPAHAIHLAAADFGMLVVGLILVSLGLGAMVFRF